jgi:cytochrome P450
MSTSTPAIDWHPEAPATLADPFPIFSRMRDEDPCHWSPRLRSWVLTRYAAIKAMCLDRDGVSSDRLRPFFASLPGAEASRIADITRYLSLWMVFKDPPEHTRLRRLTGKVFSTRAMQAMRTQAERIAERLLDDIGERDRFDLVADYAGPLPCLVIMAMLGVPAEDLAEVKRMSDEIALFIGSSRTSPEKYDTAEAATREMAAFFLRLIADRRRAPRDDALSELVHLRDGDDAFTEDELVATCILMLFAGHETTTNHIANGTHALLTQREQWERLRAQPELLGTAVEELLHFESPLQLNNRLCTAPLRIGDVELPAGSFVTLTIGSANRDGSVFPQPDRLDIGRKPNPHLASGQGPHACAGMNVARLEARIAFGRLIARCPGLQLRGTPQRDGRIRFHGWRTLPVSLR